MWDKEYACGGQCGTQRTLAAGTKNAYGTACQLFTNIYDYKNNNYRSTNKNVTTELQLKLESICISKYTTQTASKEVNVDNNYQ